MHIVKLSYSRSPSDSSALTVEVTSSHYEQEYNVMKQIRGGFLHFFFLSALFELFLYSRYDEFEETQQFVSMS